MQSFKGIEIFRRIKTGMELSNGLSTSNGALASMLKKSMKTFKTILLCLVVMVTCSTILSTAGCRSLRPAHESIISDSTKIEKSVTPRDTTFKTPTATVTVAVHVSTPCPELKNLNVDVTKDHARLTVKMDGDTLKAKCHCDTLAIRATLYDTFEKHSRVTASKTTKTVTVEVVPNAVKFFAWSGGVFWFIILMTGLYFIAKKT